MDDCDKNIMMSLQHEACEFHCWGCNGCLTRTDLHPEYGTCENCTPEPDCFAKRAGDEFDRFTWTNCPCHDCHADRVIAKAEQ
jgi:hypothetical protein